MEDGFENLLQFPPNKENNYTNPITTTTQSQFFSSVEDNQRYFEDLDFLSPPPSSSTAIPQTLDYTNFGNLQKLKRELKKAKELNLSLEKRLKESESENEILKIQNETLKNIFLLLRKINNN